MVGYNVMLILEYINSRMTFNTFADHNTSLDKAGDLRYMKFSVAKCSIY